MVPLSLALPGGAAVLWIAALVLAGVALTAAVRARRRPLRGSRALLIVTAFIVAAAVGAGTVLQSAGSVSTAGVPDRLELTVSDDAQIQTVARKPERVKVDASARKSFESRATTILVDTISATELVTASRAKAFVAAAEAAAYEPLSGLEQVFEDAVVTRVGKAHYITVPLAGTNMAAMTKVVYVYDGQTTTTVEFAAAVVDAAHARLQMWQDGISIQNVELYDPALASAASEQATVVQTGFSWSKLNKCLSNAGIPAWMFGMISLACAAVCAGSAGVGCIPCIAAAAGFGTGSIAACVYLART